MVKAAELYGFSGTPGEIAEQMQARHAEFGANNHPQYFAIKQKADALEKKYHEMVLGNHLEIIKKHNPEENARSVAELGETFLRLMQMKMNKGDVSDGDVIVAYEMARLEKEFFKQPTPPSPGPANSGAAEKEFYTPQEVDRLSAEDFKNEKIMRRVRQSMYKWRKE